MLCFLFYEVLREFEGYGGADGDRHGTESGNRVLRGCSVFPGAGGLLPGSGTGAGSGVAGRSTGTMSGGAVSASLRPGTT